MYGTRLYLWSVFEELYTIEQRKFPKPEFVILQFEKLYFYLIVRQLSILKRNHSFQFHIFGQNAMTYNHIRIYIMKTI